MADEKKELSHSESNAAAWMESIQEYVAALECDYDRLEELRDERDALEDDAERDWPGAGELAELEAAAGACASQDDARERIEESALSVQVRSDWHDPGAEGGDRDGEFQILLTTGGPALRIMGELAGGEPRRAWLEHQDWGTAWTHYYVEGGAETLLAFCRVFYFGE